ncbi:MAG: hypothetical protein K940chlam2_00515 [Chlamydiae bacterium]|nr:hypothetical protein [Chlamydiota bacterium]
MNRNRRPIPAKSRKKMEKDVLKGQKKLPADEALPKSDETTAEKEAKKYPKVKKVLIDKTRTRMQEQKKKKEHKRSKRTSPGEENEVRESPPAHIHPEGERWQKTLDLQNKTKRKKLTAKLNRQKTKK